MRGRFSFFAHEHAGWAKFQPRTGQPLSSVIAIARALFPVKDPAQKFPSLNKTGWW